MGQFLPISSYMSVDCGTTCIQPNQGYCVDCRPDGLFSWKCRVCTNGSNCRYNCLVGYGCGSQCGVETCLCYCGRERGQLSIRLDNLNIYARIAIAHCGIKCVNYIPNIVFNSHSGRNITSLCNEGGSRRGCINCYREVWLSIGVETHMTTDAISTSGIASSCFRLVAIQ